MALSALCTPVQIAINSWVPAVENNRSSKILLVSRTATIAGQKNPVATTETHERDWPESSLNGPSAAKNRTFGSVER